MPKVRLDELVVRQGLAESREQARRLILAGKVSIDGLAAAKAGQMVDQDSLLQVQPEARYVSRGGFKLEHALEVFSIDTAGMVAADVGASTGGFTDCLLQHGTSKIYALDVGRGQLAWKLRQDPRVVVQEQVNVRYLANLAEPVDLVVIDVSFISLKLILPVVISWLKPGGQVVALIKPQFEAGKHLVGKGGVIRDAAVHRQVLDDLTGWISDAGWRLEGLTNSPLLGPAGNREFLAHLVRGDAQDRMIIQAWIDSTLAASPEGTN